MHKHNEKKHYNKCYEIKIDLIPSFPAHAAVCDSAVVRIFKLKNYVNLSAITSQVRLAAPEYIRCDIFILSVSNA